jgi:hypothetical protein
LPRKLLAQLASCGGIAGVLAVASSARSSAHVRARLLASWWLKSDLHRRLNADAPSELFLIISFQVFTRMQLKQ